MFSNVCAHSATQAMPARYLSYATSRNIPAIPESVDNKKESTMDREYFKRELNRAYHRIAGDIRFYQSEGTESYVTAKRLLLFFIAGRLRVVLDKIKRLAENNDIAIVDETASGSEGKNNLPFQTTEHLHVDDVADIAVKKAEADHWYYSTLASLDKDFDTGAFHSMLATASRKLASETRREASRVHRKEQVLSAWTV